ncbi:TMV resistance protein N-like [Gastrolobium bilobum]|uniref:TMV resistance protein N-like n=1 Tax=Gastrolobium bilobum TaxID=150636 RepID=UPI002AB1E60B|nr:TMV resistance protein N-like [Gastrolobium bilobum]
MNLNLKPLFMPLQRMIGFRRNLKFHNPDGTVERYKARLVIAGNHQIAGEDYSETYAPVAKMVSVRTLLAVAAAMNWELHQLDVHNAFLNGDLSEEVYMWFPPGFSNGSNHKIIPSLLSKEGIICPSSVLVYVDDIIVAGNDPNACKAVKEYLNQCFKIKDSGPLKYFLGIEIARSKESILRKYTLDLLSESGLSGSKPSNSPIEQNLCLALDDGPVFDNPERYRRLIGKLIYLTITRPDLSYAIHILSQFMQQPKQAHFEAVVRVLRYIKRDPGRGLLLKSDCNLKIHAHYDSDWASCPLTRKSITARNSFVDHLFAHLSRKGIFAFKDDKRLEKGEPISSQLLQAIHDSRVSIVVFSPDYASSKWCLDEMASINACRINFEQTVFSIFYHVDPSHVRHQNGVYEDAFLLHTEKFKQDLSMVNRWREAMEDLAGLAGWDVRNKPESEAVENIAQEIINILGHKFSGFFDEVIGMQPHVATLESILELRTPEDKFRVLGIWGMSGIGKTTLANALYDRISYQFDACCFIEDVSKIYRDGGAVAVQKQILRQTLKEDLDKCSPSEISASLRNRLHKIKVLVVLDNVDEFKQLQELAINPKLLRAGSRMIVTTRDEHILKVYEANKIYEAQLMKDNDARQLLCRKAFKSDDSKSNSNYDELIPMVLKYAEGLPLVVGVVGTFLCKRGVPQWKDTLNRLKNSPDKKIMELLRASVDGLQDEEKEIFLHIACFFRGEREDYVMRILDACGLHPHIGIERLTQMSLIIIKNKKIHMHEILQELGKYMVRHQFPKEPGSWSRLWRHRDFHHVLMTKTGTDKVEAIVLEEKDVTEYSQMSAFAEGLSKMTGLTLLILNDMNFLGDLNFLSYHLQYLMWHGYPFTSLPSNFEPHGLVELNMRNSSIQRLWDGRKDLPSLKRIDLSNSKNLIETPIIDGIPELERLDLTGCTNLHHVDPSIGILSKLAFLSLQNCSSLVVLDFGSSSNLSSMKVLELSGCTKLENIPYFTGASNLEYLDFDQCTSLSTVHPLIWICTKLRFLSCRDCTSLLSIDSGGYFMLSLITLDLHGCSELRKIPGKQYLFFSMGFSALILLDLGFCNLSEVPDGIEELRCLERLNLEGNNFFSLPSMISSLHRLAYLNLAHCHELQSLSDLPFPWERGSSVGRYFETESKSRDYRSGLYIFDCPKLALAARLWDSAFDWLRCLIELESHMINSLKVRSNLNHWMDKNMDGQQCNFLELFSF